MEITYAGIQIADATHLKPGSGWALPGQQLVDLCQLPGAANSVPYARGNRARSFGGSVTRTFDTHGEALSHFGKHYDELPDSGAIVLSAGGVPKVTFAVAVLVACTAQPPAGVSVTHSYQFQVGAPT